jgi:alcohol dehydrogenase/L-iditol 2-dehydrogenase
MAHLSGASPLIVVGIPADAKRLDAAKKVGATATLGAAGDDVAEALKSLGDGYGVDVVIDAAGVSATLALALDIVRPGGQVTKVGWGPQPYGASLDPLVQKGVTLQGSYSHNWPMWERVIGMLANGQIDLGPILNRVSPLSDWQGCFEAMHRGEIVKAVLTP